jgi:hypothetical protein
VPLTIAVFLALSGLYGLYAMVVSPLLMPKSLQRPSSVHINEPSRAPEANRIAAERYLRDVPWAATAGYQFRTDRSILYSKTMKHVDSGDVIRFSPFALIWFQGPGEPPITMVARSALVRFKNAFDFENPNPGKVMGGVLEESVVIRGADGLRIEGSNFVFDDAAKHVRSDDPLAFQYDGHTGTAEGLQMELIAAENPAESNDLGVTGVRSVRLRRNVVMNLIEGAKREESQGTLADSMPGERPASDARLKRVRVTCQGGFEYVLESNVGTFEDNVHVVRRPVGETLADSLRCDVMTLVFESNENKQGVALKPLPEDPPADPQAGSGSGPFRTFDGDLAFRRLRAVGERVELKSEANGLTAWMTELIYDAQSRGVALSDGKAVRVDHKGSLMECPEITLRHDEEGEITTALCRGMGWLSHRDEETGRIVLKATWLKQLRKYPDRQDPALDVLELQQQAVVRQPEQFTSLAAELIKLWIDRKPGSDHGAAARGAAAGDSAIADVRPQRMLAIENVVLKSPQFHAKTDQLQVWFQYVKERPGHARVLGWRSDDRTPRRSRKNLVLTQFQPGRRSVSARPTSGVTGTGAGRQDLGTAAPPGAPLRSDPSHPDSGTSAPRSEFRAPRSPKKPEPPLVLRADLIRARVVDGPGYESPHVAEVWTDGAVDVTQNHEPGVDPLHMTGDQMHIVRKTEDAEVVRLEGKPARLRDRGYSIDGNEIFLDRARNLTWIDGEGVLRIPVNTGLEGEKLERPELLHLRWVDQMTFDGLVAAFYGDVRASLKESHMRCHEMHVQLDRRISFQERPAEQRRDEVSIRKLLCKHGVEFESVERDENGRVMDIRLGRVADLSRDHSTGRTEARGPGWFQNWRRGRSKKAAFSPTATAQANAPLESDSRSWEYTRIDFAGNSTGVITADEDARQHHMTFHERVHIVYGPVPRSNATVDPDDLPKDAGWMRCNELQITHHAEAENHPAYNYLLADGNAELDGRTFHARADTISYDESKEKYILRSTGDRKATIWRQVRPGEDFSRKDAQRMEFLPKRQKLNVFGGTGLQAAQ